PPDQFNRTSGLSKQSALEPVHRSKSRLDVRAADHAADIYRRPPEIKCEVCESAGGVGSSPVSANYSDGIPRGLGRARPISQGERDSRAAGTVGDYAARSVATGLFEISRRGRHTAQRA